MEEILYLICLNIDYLKSILKGAQCLILTISDSCITTTATTSNATITNNIDNTMCYKKQAHSRRNVRTTQLVGFK